MKIRYCLILLSFSLCLFNSRVYGYDQCVKEPTIRLAVDNWPPYQVQSAKYYGSIHRVITEAFALQHICVEYGWFPWARSLAYAKEGVWDGAALSQKTKEREVDFYFSDAIFSVDKVFFHRKDFNFNWKQLDDLKGVRIGGTIGYSYGDDFEKSESDGILDVQWVIDNSSNFMKLNMGRIDVFATERIAGHYLLGNEFDSEKNNIVHHPLPLQSVSYHVIFSKLNSSNKEMVRKFNLGLKALKSTGSIDRYIKEGLEGKYTPD